MWSENMTGIRRALIVTQLLLFVTVSSFEVNNPNPLIIVDVEEGHSGVALNKNPNLPYYGFFLTKAEQKLYHSNLTANFIRNEPCGPHNTGIQDVWIKAALSPLLPYQMYVACKQNITNDELTESKHKLMSKWQRNVETDFLAKRFYCRFPSDKRYRPIGDYCEFIYISFENGTTVLYSGGFNNDGTNELKEMRDTNLFFENEEIPFFADCRTINALQKKTEEKNDTCIVAQLRRNNTYQNYIHCCCYKDNYCPHLDYNRGDMACLSSTRIFKTENDTFSDITKDVSYNINPKSVVAQTMCRIRIDANVKGSPTFRINLNDTCTSSSVDNCTSFQQSLSLYERSVCCVINITATKTRSDLQLYEKFNNIVMKFIRGDDPTSQKVNGRFRIDLLNCRYLIEIHESSNKFFCHVFFEPTSTSTDLRIADLIQKNRKRGSLQFLVNNMLINYDSMFTDLKTVDYGCIHVFHMNCKKSSQEIFITKCISHSLRLDILHSYTMCFCGSSFSSKSCDKDDQLYKEEIDNLIAPTCYVGEADKKQLMTSKTSFVCIERLVFNGNKTLGNGKIHYGFVDLRELYGRTDLYIANAEKFTKYNSTTFTPSPIYDLCYFEADALACYCLAKWESTNAIKNDKAEEACNNGAMITLFLSMPQRSNVRDLSMSTQKCMNLPNANVTKHVFSEEMYEMCIYNFGQEKHEGGYEEYYFVNGKSVETFTQEVNTMICNISEWTALEHVTGCSCRSYKFYLPDEPVLPWNKKLYAGYQNISNTVKIAKEIYRDNFNVSSPPIITQEMLTRAQFVRQEADYLDILMALEDINEKKKRYEKTDTVRSDARKKRSEKTQQLYGTADYAFLCCCHSYISDVPKGLVPKRLKPL